MHSTAFLMNAMHSTSSLVALKPSSLRSKPPVITSGCYDRRTRHSIGFPVNSRHPSCKRCLSIRAAEEDAASIIQYEDFVDEKDWSFLETDSTNCDRIIAAGSIKETSRVLVSIASEEFVVRVMESSPCEQLIIVHDSLFVLACIKEKYDDVKCWQGEVINIPKKWSSFDVVFLYFLPALPFELDQILAAVAKRCVSGARVVISHPEGRQMVEEQKSQYPDVVVSNLPEKTALQDAADGHSFEVMEFVDEPGFYLAVLRLK